MSDTKKTEAQHDPTNDARRDRAIAFCSAKGGQQCICRWLLQFMRGEEPSIAAEARREAFKEAMRMCEENIKAGIGLHGLYIRLRNERDATPPAPRPALPSVEELAKVFENAIFDNLEAPSKREPPAVAAAKAMLSYLAARPAPAQVEPAPPTLDQSELCKCGFDRSMHLDGGIGPRRWPEASKADPACHGFEPAPGEPPDLSITARNWQMAHDKKARECDAIRAQVAQRQPEAERTEWRGPFPREKDFLCRGAGCWSSEIVVVRDDDPAGHCFCAQHDPRLRATFHLNAAPSFPSEAQKALLDIVQGAYKAQPAPAPDAVTTELDALCSFGPANLGEDSLGRWYHGPESKLRAAAAADQRAAVDRATRELRPSVDACWAVASALGWTEEWKVADLAPAVVEQAKRIAALEADVRQWQEKSDRHEAERDSFRSLADANAQAARDLGELRAMFAGAGTLYEMVSNLAAEHPIKYEKLRVLLGIGGKAVGRD